MLVYTRSVQPKRRKPIAKRQMSTVCQIFTLYKDRFSVGFCRISTSRSAVGCVAFCRPYLTKPGHTSIPTTRVFALAGSKTQSLELNTQPPQNVLW